MIGMVDDNHEPIDEEKQRCTCGHPLIFCDFGLEHAVPIHPIFKPCHLNANVARSWKGHSSSHLPVLEYTGAAHCRLMFLNDLHQKSLKSKQTTLKNVFAVLPSMALFPYKAHMFWLPLQTRPVSMDFFRA